MSDATTFLHENPMLLGILAGLAIAAVTFTGVGIMMVRSGVSLRPLAYVAGFLAIVAGPQVAFHVAQAFELIPKQDLAWAAGDATRAGWVEREEALAVRNGVFADPVAVFGDAPARLLIADLRTPGVATPFGGAEAAQMATAAGSGRTTTVARFADVAAAERAAHDFMTIAAGAVPPARPDGSFEILRPAGDAARLIVAGRSVFVFAAPSPRELDEAIAASGAIAARATTSKADGVPDGDPFWLYHPVMLTASLLLITGVAVVYGFKGAAWAATVPAVAGAPSLPAAELRAQLLAINQLDVPFAVTEEDGGLRLLVTWRYADARWAQRFQVAGLRRTHRLTLALDPATRRVRVTEQFAHLDWSAGAEGATLQWRGGRGIVFFQREQRRVFGLQLDADGRFVPQLSYAYTFDLQEMKAPFITAVTRAGWSWRPTLWQGPVWLRWLTD